MEGNPSCFAGKNLAFLSSDAMCQPYACIHIHKIRPVVLAYPANSPQNIFIKKDFISPKI